MRNAVDVLPIERGENGCGNDFVLLHRRAICAVCNARDHVSHVHAHENALGARGTLGLREVLEVLTDFDWAANTETRKFVTCMMERLGGHLWDCSVARQTAVALGSGDNESYGISRAAAFGIQSRQLIQHCLVRPCFSTSCATIRRQRESVHVQVLGKSGHLSKKELRVQQALRKNIFSFQESWTRF